MTTALVSLCAKALHDVPHEKCCNATLVAGLACTCEQRAERLTQGLAAMLRWAASNRDSLRHKTTSAIHERLIATFRHAAAADVKIRISIQRSGREAP